MAGEAGCLSFGVQRRGRFVTLEYLESPTTRITKSHLVLHHHRDAPARAFRRNAATGVPDLQQVVNQDRAVRELAAPVSLQRLVIGVEVMQSSVGGEAGMLR